MRVPRIFAAQEIHPGSEMALTGAVCRYISRVLRLHPGHELVLFDGSGDDFGAELLNCDRRHCRVRIRDRVSTEQPATLQLHLGIGVSRGERMDLAIQKSVELGVNAITPLFTERSVVQLETDRLDKRMAHWLGVMTSACEQSGRSLLPELHPASTLVDWLSGHRDGMMLYHEAEQTLAALPAPDRELNLLIGPEGGLSGSERTRAATAGFIPVKLGPRVLRTETAPVAALAAIQILWGDFR
jgi:16S rRNA (uracil1498-N3)-methyltransferase